MNPISRNAWISFGVISVFSLFLIFGVPGINREWFQFPRNYNINDNSRNWANHDYAYNLMMSAEPNAIFMTEGGDNQVFSLLYFATAQRMRPDIDFFDQKGNVFPRLYGDLLNTHPEEISLIRNIRDLQLFSTGRPIYLTWERENLDKLNVNSLRQQKAQLLKKFPPNQQAYINNKYRMDSLEQLKSTARNMVSSSVYDLTLRSGGNLADQDFRYLGPWYFKNFGMIFRVTPLRYAIMDALENLNGRGHYLTITPEVIALSKLSLIPEQFDYYVGQLAEEGYVTREGSTVVMVKPFRGNFEQLEPIEHWDHYLYSYRDVPNAGHWDFLTREIFGNNIRMLETSVSRYIQGLQKRMTQIDDLATINELQGKIVRWNEKLDQFKKTVPLYNYDNPGMIYGYAVDSARQGDNLEAARAFAMTAQANYRLNNNYLQAAELLVKEAEKGSNPQEMLDQASEHIQDYYRKQNVAVGMTGSSANQEQNLNFARALDQRIQSLRSVLVPEEKAEASSQLSDLSQLSQEAGDDVDKLKQLASLQRQQGDDIQALGTLEKILDLNPLNFEHYQAVIDLAKDIQADTALKTVERAIRDYSTLQGEKPQVWDLEYQQGNLLFNIATTMIKQDPGNREAIRDHLDRARRSIDNFLSGFAAIEATADNLQKQKRVTAEKILERIEELSADYK